MSLFERIAECHAFDPSRYLPFRIGREQVGWIARRLVARLEGYPQVFETGPDGVALARTLASFEARSRAMESVIQDLRAEGVISRRANERYAVVPLADTRREGIALMEMDRAAVPAFGVRAFGIHVNGFVRGGGGLSVWVARRAPSAALHPGKLDQLVAGGLSAGLTPVELMVKESFEEANIAEPLARRAKPVGHISYCLETPEGVSPATMFAFDLELDPRFKPVNNDGEIAAFHLWPAQEVLRRVAETRAFKPNANLVAIDFLLRHEVIRPDHPDVAALEEGLGR
jgi:hypothetical protein